MLWAIGFIFGFSNCALNFMIVYPKSFDSVWGIVVMWLTITLNGVEHLLFALEYHYSAIDISKKLSLLLPTAKRAPTHRSTQFIVVTIIYSIFQICCCVG